MGNSQQKNDEKLISTVWLGVNVMIIIMLQNDWKALMKDRLSRLEEEWVMSMIKCLAKHSPQEQNRFRQKIKQVLSETMKEDRMKQIVQQSEEFLKNNEFLREDTVIRTSSGDLTLSTSYNSCISKFQQYLVSKINENQSISSQKQEIQDYETQNAQAQKFYLVFTIINEMIKSNQHPFFYMITQFQGWAKAYLNNLQQSNQNLSQLKAQVAKFGVTTNQFLSYLIHALNEYLGDISSDQIDIAQNKYLKDKANYFNFFLSVTINETLTIQLMEVLKILHKNSIVNLMGKMTHLSLKPDFFDIPKKHMTQTKPFQEQIEYLQAIQFSKHPAEKYFVLAKGYQLLRECLTKSASSFVQLQAINYVLVHSQIQNLHAHLHLLELFYPSSPLLLKYNSSLQFLQNIII
ncbi:unnamed protein product (macronuclear) [Paramecium tetraurelia]|uniref:VPS9 domain-containing protein n=1 Tax=Paramecium tetraurelia TaxID=5888 RepID=A0CA79_PARTE|nr:uncharacterized protein GSPATT00036476001 [Paramecium tetraurelia]CAK67696.1 unnamed protein product [Paramecium tetraurelia]|eukprot:XP_001435093.1 hypothetical protein (macronuclear) [Paramecium tetraurelia strain d4-2]